MKVITKDITYRYGDEIKIKPFGDLHVGSPEFDKASFTEFFSDIDDKTYLIGTGDLLDAIITNDKRYKKGTDDCETETIIDEQVNRLYDLLLPYKDKIIALGIGNHEETIVKTCGTNPIKRLCEKLKCDYLGMKWMIRLNLRTRSGRGRSIVIYGHHGYGGSSRTEGGNLTKFSKDLIYEEADIYIFGHVHEKIYKIIPHGYHGGSKYLVKDRILMIGGSFKRNFSLNETTTWEEKMGFPPRALGGFTIRIKPNVSWVKMKVDG